MIYTSREIVRSERRKMLFKERVDFPGKANILKEKGKDP